MKYVMITTALPMLLAAGAAFAHDHREEDHPEPRLVVPQLEAQDTANGAPGIDQNQSAAPGGGAPDVLQPAAYDAPEQMTLSFIFHIDDGLAEQDVFYEKVPGSGELFRPTAATRDMDAPLYAPAVEVPHNFLDTSDTGPYPKGRPLGLTLGQWFAAEGNGTYTCDNGVGEVDFAFRNLVPNGVYTMWHDFMVWPPTDPFIGTYDLPFGARDGSENTFVADAEGDARFQRTITPCLQLSGEHLAADLGVAWHSDGKTYGPLPGEFSTVTHVQLYVALPARTGL